MVGLLVVIVAGVELGLDGISELGDTAPTPIPTPPPPALHPSARPGGTLDSSSSTPQPAPVAVTMTFDLVPIGPLAEEPPVVRIVGAPEVSSFPSPFDRSLLLTGGGDHGLCLAAEGLRAAALSVSVDVYVDQTATGTIEITVDPSAAPPVTHSLTPAGLAALAREQWFTLELRWNDGGEATLGARPRDVGTATSELPFERRTDQLASSDQAACVLLSGATGETKLMIDNVRVEQ